MLAFVWNWTHLRSADSTSIITDNIPQAVWNLWQRDRWTGSCQFQTTQFLLNYYLAVQGARRTSGSSMEICSVLQPMHCGFLVLGRLGLGHDWRACCTNTHSVAYVFSACHAGNTELWSWNWGTPSYNCCCKLLGSKQICLPHEQKKCSMRASMHRTITISEDKSGMSCIVMWWTCNTPSQIEVNWLFSSLVLLLSFLQHPGTWYFVGNYKASHEAYRNRQVLDFAYTCTSLSHCTQSSSRWSI